MTLETVKLEGVDEFNKTLARLFKADTNALDRSLAKAAFETQKESIKLINTGTRSGRKYKRRSVLHQASAPGEAPKADTGTLAKNILVERLRRLDYTSGSRKGAPHGFWLEFGTSKMEKRPWLSVSFKQVVDKFTSTVIGAIK